uniref:Uncharacterized protein n=1 Tax=Parascaris univalens TaxID=6257 RepID=A0A915BDT6_PARUN
IQFHNIDIANAMPLHSTPVNEFLLIFYKRNENDSPIRTGDPVSQFDSIVPRKEEVEERREKNIKRKEEKVKSATKRDSKSADGRKTKQNKSFAEAEHKSSKSSVRSLDLERLRKPKSITAQPLFDAAQMMCDIVDITQDSTLHHRAPPVRSLSEDADCPEGTPKGARKMLKTKSVSSATLKLGPFSAIKENEKKVKKKDSTFDLSSLQQELDE